MGTKTQGVKPSNHIETIIHGHENGDNSRDDDHDSEHVEDGYETDQAGEIVDVGQDIEEPTPLTTDAEEATPGVADEFPAVIQAGMWVQTTQTHENFLEHDSVESDNNIYVPLGSVGQAVFCNEAECQSVVFEFDVIGLKARIETNLQTGDPLPSFLEQVNAPEPAALPGGLPDSTTLDDLDGENAEPSEAETVYTTGTTPQATSAEASKRYVPRDVMETLGDIYDLSAEADRISGELDGAKAVVKELREELDVANSKLRSAALALKWSREPEPELFTQRADDSDTFAAAESQVSSADPTPAPVDESWRSISIDVLSLPGKIPEQLKAWSPSLDTIGAIADFTAKPFNKLTGIKGIGPGKATTIEDALMEFWRKNPQYASDPMPVTMTAEPATDGEDSEPVHLGQTDDDNSSTEQGAVAFDFGQTLDDNPHARGSSDWDEWRAGFKERAGMGDGDEAVGDEDL